MYLLERLNSVRPSSQSFSRVVLLLLLLYGFSCFACLHGAAAASIAVGPAALYVLRGLVCLQCNLKLPRPERCGTCKLTFCKSCRGSHFCVGKLNLPRGVAEIGEGGGGGRTGWGGGGSGSRSAGSGGGGGRARLESATLWELGSAIGDDWEDLFFEVMGERRRGEEGHAYDAGVGSLGERWIGGGGGGYLSARGRWQVKRGG